MTDSSAVEGLEHWLTIGGLIFTGVAGLLAWASGSKEGRAINEAGAEEARTSSVAAAAGGAVFAGMIDKEAYRAVIDGMEGIKGRLDAIDGKLARLVILGESQDERDERARQHHDTREMLRGLIDELREDIKRGDERRRDAPRRPAPA